MCYHWGSCTCDATQWLQSTNAPLSLFLALLCSLRQPPSITTTRSSLFLLSPVSPSLFWKSKQASVEQPTSLAPLVRQLPNKTSWCYGNSHFTDCAAQGWSKIISVNVAKVKEYKHGNQENKKIRRGRKWRNMSCSEFNKREKAHG